MTLHDLGKEIREQREKAGLTIADVATRIKVSARTLQAIENGAVESLPHAVYTKGFVRSYAKVVGFDAEDLNSRLEEAFPPESLEGTKTGLGLLVRPASSSGFFKKFIVLVLIIGVLSGIGFGVWYVTTNHGNDILEFVKQPFSAVTTPAPHDALPGAAEDPAVLAEQATPALAGFLPMSQPGTQAREVQASRPVSAPTATLFAEPAAVDGRNAQAVVEGSAPEVPERPVTGEGQGQNTSSLWPLSEHQFVFIKANQECWIGSRKDTSRAKDYVTLYPGQVWIFSFKDSLELNLGNAGGIVLHHNGRNVGSLGREKEVKTIRF